MQSNNQGSSIAFAVSRKKYQSQLTWRMLLQYLFSLTGFTIALIGAVFIAELIGSRLSWYLSEPVYNFLLFVREYLLLFFGLACLAGWSLITYYFMSRPLRYLDEVVAASSSLISAREKPIILPSGMKNVQDELNQFREQAIRSERLAKEAEQRENDLIVYLAHDLKTPLTSVIGYLTLLRDEPQLSQELRIRYTGIALDKAERLEDLINEFFDITRFNLTSLTLEVERINLSHMLAQLTSEFEPILAEKQLHWQISAEPEVEILCDPNKLERVFDNLVRNAVNYSYPQTEITLSMQRSGESVEIIIKNHGKTIPQDKLGRIFEQFFRLDSSRSSSTGGAGLGLAISKEIVELHHGSIQVESENESICFTIRLPALVKIS